MINYIKNNRGLTLIEILVTIGILGMVIVPITSMFLTTAKINNESQEKLEATLVAQRTMESIKSSESIDNIDATPEHSKFDINVYIEKEEKYLFQHLSNNSELDEYIKVQVGKEGNNIIITNNNNVAIGSYPIISTDLNFNIENTGDMLKIGFNNTNILPAWPSDSSNIVFELYGSHNLQVEAENQNSNQSLDIYFFKFEESTSQHNVINNGGKVRVYSNLLLSSDDDMGANNGRVYKIIITVNDKEGNNIETMYGYKTFL